MAMRDSLISKVWDALFQLLFSCFRTNPKAENREDLAATIQLSNSLDIATHDPSKQINGNDVVHHQNAQNQEDVEPTQLNTVENHIQVPGKGINGSEEHLQKEESQENAGEAQLNCLENNIIQCQSQHIDGNEVHHHQKVEGHEDAGITQLNSVENRMHVQIKDSIGNEVHQQEVEKPQVVEATKLNSLEKIQSNEGLAHHKQADGNKVAEVTQFSSLESLLQPQRNEFNGNSVRQQNSEGQKDADVAHLSRLENLMHVESEDSNGGKVLETKAENYEDTGTTQSSTLEKQMRVQCKDSDCVDDVCSLMAMPTDVSSTSSVNLPLDTTKPIVLIGTTVNDIAPIRTLLQERWHQKYNEKRHVGKVILYFWCKHPDLDKFYEDELQKFHEEHLVTHMHVDFIREADHMVYVDHFLTKHGYDTWDLIERQQASVYVCGDANAGIKVEKAITKIAADIGGMGIDNARSYLNELRLEGRFVSEFSP